MEDVQRSLSTFADNARVHVIEYEWDITKSPRWHHNMSRWIGIQHTDTEYLLLLDADEIFDGTLFAKYLATGKHLDYDVVSFSCYWYFREPVYRATTPEMAGSLYKKSICTDALIFSDMERWAYRQHSDLKVIENERVDDIVISNHYSWVRTKKEMLRKVISWGHASDRDWVNAVHEEFSRPFNGTDFVHGYRYEIVSNIFDLPTSN
jgi:glycosyltransferase involved in cell wall biosynthesis